MLNIYIIKHFSNNPNITRPSALSQPYIASATIENKSWNPLLTYHVLFGGLTFESFRHQIQTISSPENGCEHHQNCRNRTAKYMDINVFLIYCYLLSLIDHILSVRLLQFLGNALGPRRATDAESWEIETKPPLVAVGFLLVVIGELNIDVSTAQRAGPRTSWSGCWMVMIVVLLFYILLLRFSYIHLYTIRNITYSKLYNVICHVLLNVINYRIWRTIIFYFVRFDIIAVMLLPLLLRMTTSFGSLRLPRLLRITMGAFNSPEIVI